MERDRMEGSDKPKGLMRKEIVKGTIAIGAAIILLLVLIAVGGLTDDDGESGSDIRISDWYAVNVDGGLNFTVNATNHGNAIGAATITCQLETYNATFSVDHEIHLGSGKSYSFVIFLPLPQDVMLEQGDESVSIVQS